MDAPVLSDSSSAKEDVAELQEHQENTADTTASVEATQDKTQDDTSKEEQTVLLIRYSRTI